MTDKIVTLEQFKDMHRSAMIGGAVRALGLVKRVPEVLKARGWPVDDDLVSVLIGALACKKWGAGRTRFRRPSSAEGLGGLWPADKASVTASQIVDTLELDDLLSPR